MSPEAQSTLGRPGGNNPEPHIVRPASWPCPGDARTSPRWLPDGTAALGPHIPAPNCPHPGSRRVLAGRGPSHSVVLGSSCLRQFLGWSISSIVSNYLGFGSSVEEPGQVGTLQISSTNCKSLWDISDIKGNQMFFKIRLVFFF